MSDKIDEAIKRIRGTNWDLDKIRNELLRARAEGRREGLEEAATFLDQRALPTVAERLRALIEKEGK